MASPSRAAPNPDVARLPREAILAAAERFETPFFLYDEARLRDNCRRFAGAFRRRFADFQPLFAVKANPNPEVLKVVAAEGFGMDASSETEVWLCHRLGYGGMYTANYTTAERLRFALERGFTLNLDDMANVPMLAELGPPPEIAIRLNPGVGKATTQSCVTAGPDAKYGVPHERAVEAYRRARDLGVERFGIHMMTGSNVPLDESDYFTDVVERLFEVVVALRDQLGIEIGFMNIGGGFGVPYRPEEPSLDLERVAEGIKQVFDHARERHGLAPIRLMAEPGRIIAADAGWLVARVVLIKDSYKRFVGLDASSNDMPRPSIYGSYHHVTALNDAAESEVVSVVGSVCENNDQFARDRLLPRCAPGDVVAIHNCGAHAHAMGHNYNGKLRHAEYMLEDGGGMRRIRRAETVDDHFRTVDVG